MIAEKMNRGMRMCGVLAAVAGVQAAIAGAASAQFTGGWAHNQWIGGVSGNGSFGDANLSSSTLTLGLLSSSSGNVHGNQVILVPAGTWQLTFDWTYTTQHSFMPAWAGYQINGILTQLASNPGTPYSGSVTTPLLHGGDWFSFEMESSGGSNTYDLLEISKFTVPSPGALGLVSATGVVGCCRRRRRG